MPLRARSNPGPRGGEPFHRQDRTQNPGKMVALAAPIILGVPKRGVVETT